MKKFLSVLLLIAVLCLTLSGCGFIGKQSLSVKFYVDGDYYATTHTFLGSTITEPEDPYKNNMLFAGWYLDKECTHELVLTGPIYTDLSLYAKFIPDAVALSRTVATELASKVVTVHNVCYNSGFAGIIQGNSTESQGSGVVYQISNGFCYVLTNAHVVSKEDGYSNQRFTVTDPWGNEHEARIYKNANLATSAVSTDHDLALLCFEYVADDTAMTLTEADLAQSDAKVGDYVVSIGSPYGQSNSATCGQIMQFGKINVSNEESKFEGIYHSAYINHGSSGGALFDMSGKLVGINFAGQEDGSYGCAIPISAIKEFMRLYVNAN